MTGRGEGKKYSCSVHDCFFFFILVGSFYIIQSELNFTMMQVAKLLDQQEEIGV